MFTIWSIAQKGWRGV